MNPGFRYRSPAISPSWTAGAAAARASPCCNSMRTQLTAGRRDPRRDTRYSRVNPTSRTAWRRIGEFIALERRCCPSPCNRARGSVRPAPPLSLHNLRRHGSQRFLRALLVTEVHAVTPATPRAGHPRQKAARSSREPTPIAPARTVHRTSSSPKSRRACVRRGTRIQACMPGAFELVYDNFYAPS
jgi:hypothetical protein